MSQDKTVGITVCMKQCNDPKIILNQRPENITQSTPLEHYSNNDLRLLLNQRLKNNTHPKTNEIRKLFYFIWGTYGQQTNIW